MRRCRVAATQVEVRQGDVEHNLETHVRLIAEPAEAGCNLVVFPELSVTGHNGGAEVTRVAEPADGRIARVIREAATAGGIVVSYGFCELHRGTHYNGAREPGLHPQEAPSRDVRGADDPLVRRSDRP